MAPQVDLVITFRAIHKQTLSKLQTRDSAQRAEQQYNRLIETLSYAGLHAVGRRGESLGHLLVLVHCPETLLQSLIQREKQSDFLSGLPTTPTLTQGTEDVTVSSADRLRLVHAYITSIPSDGGLGVIPASKEWDLVESVMCLHDRQFNDQWIHAWTTRNYGSVSEEKIRDHFGDSVSLYFSFLHTYTHALYFPAALGAIFYFLGKPYSPIYSSLLLVWSTVYVEYWRTRERIISLRHGTRGSFRVEKRRAQYTPGFQWWRREMRILASLPVILIFAAALVALLTGIFVFEAFITKLYTGPGAQVLKFSPTVLFVLLVPRLLAVYQISVRKFTDWENHAHHSSHQASLTLKTFALSSLVAYLGLALSAFVYVPFGEGLMKISQAWLFSSYGNSTVTAHDAVANMTDAVKSSTETKRFSTQGLWDVDFSDANKLKTKLNAQRLRDQMFAYTVTNQIVGTFLEVGLPFILRAVAKFRSKRAASSTPAGSPNGKNKKKVIFEDEKPKGGVQEVEFLESVREQAALPEYDLFVDYNEMVTQFGYVAMWSTIWPLAPVMALLNNILELRSDAFKMTVHNRRPIPFRTDTIGPWLDALTFLTWLGALTNSALVYLFCPRPQCADGTTVESPIERVHGYLFNISSSASNSLLPPPTASEGAATKELLLTALLIALAASHGYLILRVIVRHVMQRLVYDHSKEVKEREVQERSVKETFIKTLLPDGQTPSTPYKRDGMVNQKAIDLDPFWEHDEGVDEIRRISKEA